MDWRRQPSAHTEWLILEGGDIEGTRVEIFLINLILGGVYCCIDDGFWGGWGWMVVELEDTGDVDST